MIWSYIISGNIEQEREESESDWSGYRPPMKVKKGCNATESSLKEKDAEKMYDMIRAYMEVWIPKMVLCFQSSI